MIKTTTKTSKQADVKVKWIGVSRDPHEDCYETAMIKPLTLKRNSDGKSVEIKASVGFDPDDGWCTGFEENGDFVASYSYAKNGFCRRAGFETEKEAKKVVETFISENYTK